MEQEQKKSNLTQTFEVSLNMYYCHLSDTEKLKMSKFWNFSKDELFNKEPIGIKVEEFIFFKN